MDFRKHTSVKEEIFSSISHGFGIVLGIAFLLIFISLKPNDDPLKTLSFGIFGAAVTLFYLISTLFHSLSYTRVKGIFKILDHSFIFLLIAATYTPFTLIVLKGNLGWSLFLLIWVLAILGTLYKIFFVNKLKWLSLMFYLSLGWLALVAVVPLSQALPFSSLFLLILGGFLYSLGIIFYLWKTLPFNHGIWHIFVLAATFCHALALLQI